MKRRDPRKPSTTYILTEREFVLTHLPGFKGRAVGGKEGTKIAHRPQILSIK